MDNNSIYNKNIASLKDRFKDVYEYLTEEDADSLGGDSENTPADAAEASGDAAEHTEHIEAEVVYVDEKPCLAAYKDGRCIQLQSLYSDDEMVEQFFDFLPKDWQLNAKYLMFGLGNGMYARYFLKHTTKDHKILVVEPSLEIFKAAIGGFDLTDLFEDERFIFTVIKGDDKNKYESFFNSVLVYTDVFSFRFGYHANYDNLFEKELHIWDEQFSYILYKIKGANILYEVHGLDFVRNNYTFFPYAAKSKSLADLSNKMPEDVPMIIVSAGPSLNKNMQELKRAKGKALIIAVDAAVNPLVRNGIIPDINICVDPSKGEEYISEKGAEQVPLVCGMNAGRALTRTHTGVKILFSDNNVYTRKFFDDNGIDIVALSTGGSVSTNAYSLARYLNAKRVILVGQDLAFTNDESHAKGSVRGDETLEEITGDYVVIEDTDIYGNPVKSSEMFKIFRMWFEKQIELFPEIRLIDATEGGALIKGSEVMTLSEAIDKECTKAFDFDEVLNRTENLLDGELEDKFNKYIDELPLRLNKLKKKIAEAADYYEEINKLAEKKYLDNAAIKKKSKKANALLSKIQDDEATEYLKFLIQKYTDKMLRTINSTKSDIREELSEISSIGMDYLSELDKAIDELLEVIGEYR